MSSVNESKVTPVPDSLTASIAENGTTTQKLDENQIARGHITKASRAFSLSGVSEQAVVGECIIMGFDINDDDSGNVHIHIYNGTDNSGTIVGSAVPANGEHETIWLGPNGIYCPNGIYVSVESGTASGSIFYRI